MCAVNLKWLVLNITVSTYTVYLMVTHLVIFIFGHWVSHFHLALILIGRVKHTPVDLGKKVSWRTHCENVNLIFWFWWCFDSLCINMHYSVVLWNCSVIDDSILLDTEHSRYIGKCTFIFFECECMVCEASHGSVRISVSMPLSWYFLGLNVRVINLWLKDMVDWSVKVVEWDFSPFS